MASRVHVERAIEQYQEELAQYPNVTGIGVVPVADDSDRRPRGAVYVTKKVPRDQLKAGSESRARWRSRAETGRETCPRIIATEFVLEDQFDIEPG